MIAKYPITIKLIYIVVEVIFLLITKLSNFFWPLKRNSFKNDKVKILLLEPYQMGDVIALSVLLNPIKQAFPNSDIHILCKTSDFFEKDTRVKALHSVDFAWTAHNENRWKHILGWKGMLNELTFLKKFNFDIGIETRGDIRSQFILNFLGVKQTIGYKQAITTNLKNFGLLVTHSVDPKYKHRFEWNTYLLTALGVDEKSLFPLQLPSFFIEKTSNQTQNYILIHIGGGWKYKLWNNQRWILLIEKLIEKYNLLIRVIGGWSESENLEYIKNHFRDATHVSFEITDFQQLSKAIYFSELFICIDSGPQNLASCMNKKSIVLFGPGHSEAFRPYSKDSKFIHKIQGFDCHPCFQQVCKYSDRSCMTQIEVQDVLELISF